MLEMITHSNVEPPSEMKVFHGNLKPGNTVEVTYNPKKPNKNFIQYRSDAGNTVFFVVFGLMFFCPGIYFGWLVVGKNIYITRSGNLVAVWWSYLGEIVYLSRILNC